MVHNRPRLWAAAAVGALVYALAPAAMVSQVGSKFLLAWNAGALLYLVLAAALMWRSDTESMRRRALREDDGRMVVLALVVIAALTVLYAVASQLVGVKDVQSPQRELHLAAGGITVLTSWFFTQTMFAIHYAHDFYLARSRRRPDPLQFPGSSEPGYRDFVYFAFIIGTSAQTADVAFSGNGLRGIGTVHCVLSFFFNTTVLALAVNIAASLLQ